jgi:hypothetical protein
VTRLFPAPLDIGETEGFDKDLFGFAEFGHGLTNLVTTVADPLVMAIDGQWGTGKSTFLRMWAGELRNAGFPVVHFDAFEHDYLEDAFLALAGEIIGLVQEKKRDKTPEGKAFLEKTVSAGKVIARTGVKVLAKSLTLAAVSNDDIDEIASVLADGAGELADKAVESLLKDHKGNKDQLQAFRAALSELPELLVDSSSVPDGERRPLILIVDELDRCRPNFALEILERAKHFFSVENVHFVLGANLRQLENSITRTYGVGGLDAGAYLQKFIHLAFQLPETGERSREKSRTTYIKHLERQLDFPKSASRDLEVATALIGHVAEHRELSLRTIERIMTVLAVGMAFTDRLDRTRYPVLLAGLAVLKVLDAPLYAKAKAGTLRFEEVRVPFALHVSTRGLNLEWVADWWGLATNAELSEEKLQRFSEVSFYFHGDRGDLLPYLSNSLVERFLPPR